MEYERMLDRVYMSLPKEALTKERFEIPRVDSFVEGTKTIIRNFSNLAKLVRRTDREIYKFFTKEFAVPAQISGERLILNGKFFGNQVQTAYESYVKSFVLCHECHKPDTHYVDQSGVRILKCEACGAISSVKHI
ncbi:MAG: translation initiation factor IF-2 subunit beta [Candidatus Diapherotrites archaeon]|uniref:Translation initiation factor IF-2 subunit beta n=1 Tax=Candidatus Iainarchaeum sp. TaxID=3101447 RepID=A0A8T4L8J7_9ARCH|nr:translation initiation factor IF-2 subunit beta [Candidatus Diapherotrites archaeon]